MNALRFDPGLRVVRSVGDPPGILVVILPDRRTASFGVHPKWEPTSPGNHAVEDVQVADSDDPHRGDVVAMELADVIDGISDPDTALGVWNVACGCFVTATNQALIPGARFAEIRALVDLLEETRTKLEILADLNGWSDS